MVWIKSVVEIKASPDKKSALGQRLPVQETHSNGNGKPGANGNGQRHQNGINGNGTPLGARYSERVLSNFYLASYLFYSLIRSLDGNSNPEISFKTKVGLKFKRLLDIILSVIGLILLFPFFLVFAILIKLDSEGPALYKQERIGQNRRRSDRRRFALDIATECRTNRDRRREEYFGRPFTVYKFRTMHKDAEKKCGPVWALADDPRITRFGRFLRKSRLDEFPQLWNVLKGDMSLVGPRPERYHFIKNYARSIRRYTDRFYFKPGITGLAQVQSGYDYSDQTVKRKLTYDLSYTTGWKLRKDVRILYETMHVMISGKGAH